MAQIELALTESEIQGLFRGDRGMTLLLKPEIANHLGADPHEPAAAPTLLLNYYCALPDAGIDNQTPEKRLMELAIHRVLENLI